MSNLFYRVNPENATVTDVQKALEEITEWDWTTGYSFAHIVIDDKNLSNRDILFCLQPNQIASVMNDRLEQQFGCIPDLFSNPMSEPDISLYEKQIKHMAEVIDLLNWLLDVPENIRGEVE